MRTRRMVLRMEVQSASGSMVALERRVRRRRPADLVIDPCAWNDETLKAGFGGVPAEIRVLTVQKGAFVKQSDLLEYLTANEQTTAGYPACPDHAEKQTLFALLDAQKNAEIKLTESFAMHPGASVSGLYFSHPDAKYFGIGQIGRDQLVDYATRRGESVAEAEKRLAPNLDYSN